MARNFSPRPGRGNLVDTGSRGIDQQRLGLLRALHHSDRGSHRRADAAPVIGLLGRCQR